MRKLLWFFGALIFISIVMFFINPSMFTQQGSMWTEYEEWDGLSFSTVTYDLYKPVGHRTVVLQDEPIVTVWQNQVQIELYAVSSLEYSGYWPYMDLLESRKSSVDNMVYFGAIATENECVIAKNLVYIREDISERIKLDENTFYDEYLNENLMIEISILDYNEAVDNLGWTYEMAEFYKHWVYNDLDKEIIVSFSLDKAR